MTVVTGRYSGGIYGAHHYCKDGACCGTVSETRKAFGGAIRVNNGGELIMEGGNIVGNRATSPYYRDKKYSSSQIGGAAVYVDEEASFTMNGGTIQGNALIDISGGDGGAIYNKGTVTIGESALIAYNDIRMNGNENATTGFGDGLGGAVYNCRGASLTNGGIISHNRAGGGGGIYNRGTVTNYGSISENWAQNSGGVCNDCNSILINKESGLINGNEAIYDGGGVENNSGRVENYGQINDNIVTDAPSESGGGGVYTSPNNSAGAPLEVERGLYNYGQINNNIVRAENARNDDVGGGGVYNYSAYVLNAPTGQINGNTVEGKYADGGGVHFRGSGVDICKFDNYGQINNNKIASTSETDCILDEWDDTKKYIYVRGAGVYVYASEIDSMINHSDGQINGNYVYGSVVPGFGGGVYVENFNPFVEKYNLFTNHGSVSGNKASYGGGVFAYCSGLTVGGSCQIDENLDTYDKNSNVSLIIFEIPEIEPEDEEEESGLELKLEDLCVFIDTASPLTDGARIGLNCLYSSDFWQLQLSSFDKRIATKNYADFYSDVPANTYFYSDRDEYGLKINDAGEVEIVDIDDAESLLPKLSEFITVEDVDAVYDGKAHGIELSCEVEDVTVVYGTSEDSYDLTESPKYTNVSETPVTVYYKVSKDGYTDATGSKTITIQKRPINVTGLKVKNKKADATVNADFDYTAVIFENRLDGDDLALDVQGTFDDASIGKGKTVTITNAELTGAAAGNYELEVIPSLTADIEAITVDFNTNGGNEISSATLDKAGSFVEEPTTPVKEGSIFDGWFSDEKLTKAWNFYTDKADDDLTLYAKWITQKTFSVTVYVKEGSDYESATNLGDACVELKRGVEILKTAMTNDSGFCSFDNVIEGEYNIVVTKYDSADKTKSTKEKIKTEKISITDTDVTIDVLLPSEAVSSVLDIQEVDDSVENNSAVKTNQILVDGLDDEAVNEALPDSNVEVRMEVTQQNETDAGDEIAEAIDEIKSLSTAGEMDILEHLDIVLKKYINDEFANNITTTSNVLEILIPFDFTGKKNIRMFRFHDDGLSKSAEELKENTSKEDGTFYTDKENKAIHLFGKKYSLYSVGYDTDVPYVPSVPSRPSYTPSDSTTDDKEDEENIPQKPEDEKPEEKPEEKSDEEKHNEEVAKDLNKKVSSSTASKLRNSVPTSDFTRLQPVVKKNTKTSIILSWLPDKDADGYMIYGSKCNTRGNKYKIKLIKTVGADITKLKVKELDAATYYKFQILAYKLVDGNRVVIAKTPIIHTTTKGGKYGVAKSVRIDSVAGKKYDSEAAVAVTLKKGKTASIKATEIKEDKPIRNHRQLAYVSSNKKIATVDKNGNIKSKKKGTCDIYVYAQNGIYNTITVTVK